MKPLTKKFLDDWFDNNVQELDQTSCDVIELLIDNFEKWSEQKKEYYNSRTDYLLSKRTLDGLKDELEEKNKEELEILKYETRMETQNSERLAIRDQIISQEKDVIIIETINPNFETKTLKQIKKELKTNFNRAYKEYVKMHKQHELFSEDDRKHLLDDCTITATTYDGADFVKYSLDDATDYAEYKMDLDDGR